jgi:hypothetical protein
LERDVGDEEDEMAREMEMEMEMEMGGREGIGLFRLGPKNTKINITQDQDKQKGRFW